MEKSDFVNALKDFKKDIAEVEKVCQKTAGQQIQARTRLERLESLATNWFEYFEPILRSTFHFEEEILDSFREPFGKLLELSGGRPSKKVILTILESILNSYHVRILVPVQKHAIVYARFPSLDSILLNAVGLEVEYLTEAIECANLGKRRAAIILAWCAAVNRLHLYIEKEGFAKFNQASVQMATIQTGRYKRFNKKFDIQNLSDLRMTVFDNDLLWVLEFLGSIDGNQHERLEICFTMRNTSAHPGEANITDENLLSFFSDISSLIFANPKFAMLPPSIMP
jgi:hypothetical protein